MDKIQLARALLVKQRENAKSDYYSYVKYTHQSIYEYTRHGEFICNVIDSAIKKREAMFQGLIPKETQYLMFTVPSQHGKSMHITETLPSYFFGKFPNHGCIEISYNEGFASKFGKRNRDKVNEVGEELFNISIPNDERSSTEWGICLDGKKTRGGMISRGIMSGITGSSLGDLVIMDDVVKNRQEANSETTRNAHWSEWTDSISKRVHPGGIVILIMTRWHEDDLAGRLLSTEYGELLPWNVYNLPIECDEYHIEKEGNPLNRELGEPLWPEMYGLKEIEKRKQYPQTFNAMDQGRPTATEGNLLKRHYWNYYTKTDEFINRIPTLVLSVDATFKNSDASDNVAIHVWGKIKENYFLVDITKAKMDFNTTVQAIRNTLNKYPNIGFKFVEDKANGTAIMNVLHKEIGGIVPVNPMGDKVSRANSILPYAVAGNIFLPRGEVFVHSFIEECASFPNGAHDDDVDAFTQAISQMLFYMPTVKKDERVYDESEEYVEEILSW